MPPLELLDTIKAPIRAVDVQDRLRHRAGAGSTLDRESARLRATRDDGRVTLRSRGWLSGLLVSAALVAAVTGVLLLLEGHAPVSSLAVVYLLAVLPVAVVWGAGHGVVVSVASTAVFDFFFVPPKYSFRLADSRYWVVLAAFLVTAVTASRLAARSRDQAREVHSGSSTSRSTSCASTASTGTSSE